MHMWMMDHFQRSVVPAPSQPCPVLSYPQVVAGRRHFGDSEIQWWYTRDEVDEHREDARRETTNAHQLLVLVTLRLVPRREPDLQ